MKHYVFHLFSVILLIVFLLITLDLVRNKQEASKRFDELTQKKAAVEELADRERTENAARTEAAEQAREKERAESTAKIAGLEAENKDFQGKLAMLEESVSEMERRFQLVSARDVKMLGLAFEQTPRSDADAATAVTLADSLKSPSPDAFKSGQLYHVTLTVTMQAALRNCVVVDMLPAGLEIENQDLRTSAKVKPAPGAAGRELFPNHVEPRDDRLLIFADVPAAPCRYTYLVRAVAPGKFALPAVEIGSMYDPTTLSRHGAGTITVK